MGADAEEYYSMGHIDRPGKKPSLHSRLQNGTLQNINLINIIVALPLFYIIIQLYLCFVIKMVLVFYFRSLY